MAEAIGWEYNPEVVKIVRSQLGYTQRQFAEQLGVSQMTIVRWEGGNASPSVEHLAKMYNLSISHGQTNFPWLKYNARESDLEKEVEK